MIMKDWRRDKVQIIRFIVNPDEQTRYETVSLTHGGAGTGRRQLQNYTIKMFSYRNRYKSIRRHRYGSICKLSERIIII